MLKYYLTCVLSLLMVVAGLACVAILATVCYTTATSLGTDAESSRTMGSAALAIDVIGVCLFSAVAGYFIRQGMILRGVVFSVVVALSGILSLTMFYGFSAANRIEPVKVAAAKHKAALSARADASTKADAARERQIAFLQKQADRAGAVLAKARNKQARESARDMQQLYLNQATSLTLAASATIEPVQAEVNHDPMASALAQRLNWEVSSVQEALSLGLGGLLLVIEALCFGFGFRLWPARPEAEAVVAKPVPETVPEAPAVVDVALPPPLPVAEVEPAMPEFSFQPAFDVIAQAEAIDDGVRQLAHTLRSTAVKLASNALTDKQEQVMAWVNQATRRAPAVTIAAADCYRHYVKWATENEADPMSAVMFGRCLTALNERGRSDMARDNRGGVAYYTGRALSWDWVEDVVQDRIAA